MNKILLTIVFTLLLDVVIDEVYLDARTYVITLYEARQQAVTRVDCSWYRKLWCI